MHYKYSQNIPNMSKLIHPHYFSNIYYIKGYFKNLCSKQAKLPAHRRV